MTVPFFRPSIGAEEKAGVQRVLDSGWLTTGKVAREFEERFAEYVGARYAVALNSCTAALHLGLEAYGVREGDLVLVPTMTFAATAEVVRYFGARPVLVDCDPRTLLVDPGAMEAAAAKWAPTGKLKAMIPMHYGGQMCDMDAMNEIAKRYHVSLLEDAAHTLPAYYRSHSTAPWRSVGETSPMACFSFYANKCITTGEGGMLTTSDQGLAERVRMMSLHGLSKNAWTRFEAKGSWYYEIVEAGFKYNMTDVAAAIGLGQLARANELWRERQALAVTYRELLANCGDLLTLHPELEDRQSSWHLFPVQLNLEALAIDRAQFIEEMKAAGITCSVHWMPLHLHPYYVREYHCQPEEFPQASAVWPRLVSLPLFPGMSPEEIQHVATSAKAIVQRHARQAVGV
ncbi:MAG: DegT/DnrJ/EryC1/StrS family aminotransferase [Bryobacteraceae bacterium]|nr:DegT/DnrJ/EryC1/StrS family aminotransferase [Bryobacteraceae bacterium]